MLLIFIAKYAICSILMACLVSVKAGRFDGFMHTPLEQVLCLVPEDSVFTLRPDALAERAM